MSRDPSRRTVLKGAVALAAFSVTGFSGEHRRSQLPSDPFTLGVASGEPTPDGAVLWTRLAPDPLADDGLGGMPDRAVDVEWEVAADEGFTRIERRGSSTAVPASAHSVHVELAGLRPGADYFYRFRTADHLSPAGRTRTAPEPRSMAALTMCFASCSHYEQGWFTAYRRLAEEHPDLVVHLGDYQYEYAAEQNTGVRVRDHVGPETVTLANYRQRYAQYKTDPDLQAAHAVAPWLVVFDDHEVANNWADEVPDKPEPGFPARRAAALQAYYENMPLRRSAAPRGTDMQLYRRVHWGGLATFHMLDTRQYRTDQPCGDEFRSDCAERHAPSATLTGGAQERWLLDGFARSQARWDVLGQQVFFSQVDLTPGPGRGYNPDAWDGYTANRERIVAGLVGSPVRNAVVLTGDVHSHWAAEVRERVDDPSSRMLATELVTTSITSGGDGSDSRDDVDAVLPENPHIRYFSNRRGYVRTRITADALQADFKVLPFVSRPDAPAITGASFVIADREPALRSV
ncbi:alkaline phosphatase [Mycobacterium sp. URHB0044]|uniref:alkaline phosphatase D family protein n=1 Tax=Mycobacterium sp. URHB0044 TaxID=1380386 RepID=UPI00048B1EFA|nr:alkaline phosphatase D family protein [Mycobacterium sp. URHB0044]